MELRNFYKVFYQALAMSGSIMLLSSCSSNNPPPPAPGPGGVVVAKTAVESPSNSFASTAVCTENAFLQKYQCSFTRIEQAARAGDPDAQYALGYLYYYGIGATQDQQTGLVWIKRAAAQGQPVAKNALKVLSTSNTRGSLHTTSSTQANMSTAPDSNPDEPISNYLPNYGQDVSNPQ